MLLTEWLDDLCARFIINLPVEELSSAARICFQIEEAQWFYEDFVRPLHPEFPSLNLRQFCAVMFHHCPLLVGFSKDDQERAFQAFLEYKTMVPVRGAIMLNDDMDEVVLVKGWKKSANWSFPRGKIDQNELDLTCAVREVYEETGYNLRAAGLVGKEEDMKSINVQIRGQDLMMYVFRGVPMDTEFIPRTRKEISKVQWHRLSELPTVKSKKQHHEGQGDGLAGNANKFYMVAPFLQPLKKWIAQQRRHAKTLSANTAKMVLPMGEETDVPVSDQEQFDIQTKALPSNDHLNRLLQTLRQSSQVVGSDLPEVSLQQPSDVNGSRSHIDQSAELKALLFSKAGHAEPKPQTPFEQIIGPISAPRAPHVHARNANDLGIPPRFAMGPQTHRALAGVTNLSPGFAFPTPRENQSRPNGPQYHPVRHVAMPNMQHPLSSNRDRMLPPLQVLEPNMIPKTVKGPDQLSFAAPAPGKIPMPNLDSQKSALLNLFKAQATPAVAQTAHSMFADNITGAELATGSFPAQVPAVPGRVLAVGKDSAPSAVLTGSRSSVAGPENAVRRPSSTVSNMFVPSQVSRRSSDNATVTQRQPTPHQSKLLDMFKAPAAKSKSDELMPPETVVELSASPRGHHSRNPSGTMPANVTARPPQKGAQLGQIKIQKRPQREDEPVSATVSGPLDSPHFDMVRIPKQETHEPASTEQAKKISPMRILSRPTSSHNPGSISTQPDLPQRTRATRTHSKPQQPATPDLKPKDQPLKQFQPQILRRPVTASDTNILSPMDPLPSPQHKVATSKESPTPAADHKKSLLSLFTKSATPSPVISPPDNGPVPQTDTIAGLISPIEKTIPSPVANSNSFKSNGFHPTSIAAAFEPPPTRKQEPPAVEPIKMQKKYYAPDRMPQQVKEKSLAVRTDVEGVGQKTSSNTPQSSTITPANQKYLLELLHGLK